MACVINDEGCGWKTEKTAVVSEEGGRMEMPQGVYLYTTDAKPLKETAVTHRDKTPLPINVICRWT